MDLHRSGAKPQWQGVARSRRNFFQRLAARTHSLVTPGNVLTTAGFIVAALGVVAILHARFTLGLTCIVLGRLGDVADGYAASATKTKSPLGELLDATADKLITLLTLLACGLAGIASWYLLVGILATQGSITVVSWLAVQDNRRLHPSRVGKLSMAGIWLSVSGLLLAAALQHNAPLETIAYLIGWSSLALAVWAFIIYLRDYHTA
jgi:phosphatidylglycerophosphate synthase